MQTIIQWLDQQGAVIDIRDHADFEQLHLINSCNIPCEQLVLRAHELPHKGIEIALLAASDEQSVMARDWFQQRGYQVKHIWLAAQLLHVDVSCYCESGHISNYLWQPNGLLKRCLEKNWLSAPGAIVDIGCGSGRDSVFLATHGFEVVAIDYRAELLERAEQLAQTQGTRIQSLCRDIEKTSEPFADLPLADAIIVFRYLHRPLFSDMMSLIKPNGLIIYQTFMQGCEQFGRPKNPNYLLAPGELATVFRTFDILLDDVEHLEDGRPVNSFVARKQQ